MAESLWILDCGVRFRRQDVEDVPDWYLRWLTEQDWFCKRKDNLQVVEAELDYRDRFNRHID